jgi:hypothetical protein
MLNCPLEPLTETVVPSTFTSTPVGIVIGFFAILDISHVAIAKVLKDEGNIANFSTETSGAHVSISVELKYYFDL